MGHAGDRPSTGREQSAERAGWERTAGILGAYRERFGWDHPGDAIGPRPATTHPERRAEWDGALQVLPRVDGVDLRGLTDGQLLARRTAYERECAWQPPHVAGDLRLARKAEIGALTEAARFRYDAEAAERAGDLEAAARLPETHAQHEAVAGLAARIRENLEEAHGVRKQWNAITETTRRVGHAADVGAAQARHPHRSGPAHHRPPGRRRRAPGRGQPAGARPGRHGTPAA